MNTGAILHADTPAARLTHNPLTQIIDRWIYVFMAAFFIVIVLVGFIPDSVGLLAAVNAGERPPLPPIMHVHAVLMGSFMLLLLTQTALAATGRIDLHRRLGLLGAVIAPALVVVGFLLVPTIYRQIWGGLQAVPPEQKAAIQNLLLFLDNIMLVQIRIGLLFSIFIAIALTARKTDPGLHKRMMFLAVVVALPAAFDRMTWLPTTMPASPLAGEFYTLFAISPMFVWDLIRHRKIHKAYVIWLAIYALAAVAVYGLWDSEWWHATAPRLVGV